MGDLHDLIVRIDRLERQQRALRYEWDTHDQCSGCPMRAEYSQLQTKTEIEMPAEQQGFRNLTPQETAVIFLGIISCVAIVVALHVFIT